MNLYKVILFSIAVACTGTYVSGIKVQVRVGLTKRTFEEVPTEASLAAQQWARSTPTCLPGVDLYCHEDGVLCGLYQGEELVGVQAAYQKSLVSEPAFEDFAAQGFVDWTFDRNGTQTEFYATCQLFRSPDVLSGKASIGEEADQSVESNQVLKQGAVWVQGFHGQMMNFSTSEDVIKQSAFTEQGCQIGKGRHYLYNLTRSGPDCAADTILHWFPITHNGHMVATGLFLLAKVATAEGQKNWYERPPGLGIRVLVPRAPDCLYSLADSPGVVSTHIYYVEHPNLILCPLILL